MEKVYVLTINGKVWGNAYKTYEACRDTFKEREMEYRTQGFENLDLPTDGFVSLVKKLSNGKRIIKILDVKSLKIA